MTGFTEHGVVDSCWLLGKLLMLLPLSADFFSKFTFQKKFFQEYFQSVKWFGSRSGPTYCWSLSVSKLFAKDISRQQKYL